MLIQVEGALPLVLPSYDDGRMTEEEIRATWWKHFQDLQPKARR